MARILLIDDDALVRTTLLNFLNHDGHQVVETANGAEAQKILNCESYDLILTDIVMPEKDGLEVIMSQLNRPDRPKIIAISGGSSNLPHQMLLDIASKMKVDAVLTKPVSYDVLSAAVTAALQKY
jgi:CheY-like chemotaxis protein